MHYCAQKRPTIHIGQPAYCNPMGQPIGPLRGLEVQPLACGLWNLSALLLVDTNVGRVFNCQVPEDQLLSHLLAFAEDPEQFYACAMGYQPPSSKPTITAARREPIKQLKLEDLF